MLSEVGRKKRPKRFFTLYVIQMLILEQMVYPKPRTFIVETVDGEQDSHEYEDYQESPPQPLVACSMHHDGQWACDTLVGHQDYQDEGCIVHVEDRTDSERRT